MTTQKIAIDPIVALEETTLKADAVEAFYRNRNLILAQQVKEQRDTIETQAAEIERLKAPAGEEEG